MSQIGSPTGGPTQICCVELHEEVAASGPCEVTLPYMPT
jgi:hypothetical protein